MDTSALIALERRHAGISKVWRLAQEEDRDVTVPAVVLAEWWHGRGRGVAALVDGVRVEPLTKALARVAGEARCATGATAIDSIVMASAAARGDVVYTQDIDDFTRLRDYFPGVKVFRA